jgi:hypothetical protein
LQIKFIAVVFVTAWSASAFASSCVQRTPEQIAQSAEIAFVGTIAAIEALRDIQKK